MRFLTKSGVGFLTEHKTQMLTMQPTRQFDTMKLSIPHDKQFILFIDLTDTLSKSLRSPLTGFL